MNFLSIAQSDKAFTLKDSVYGFGTVITLTDPDLFSETVTGRTNDINQVIDPGTGVAISGRTATIAIDIQEIVDKGFASLPANQSDKTKKPWIVEFTDQLGNAHTFKVLEANPDRTLGIILCTLEFYSK